MQPHNEKLKYLLDVDAVIQELEKIVAHHHADYSDFVSNFISIRAVERDLMIIGEAIVKLLKIDPAIKISSAKHIIGLRNMIVHAYDSIDPTTLWKILIKDLPILKLEVNELLNFK